MYGTELRPTSQIADGRSSGQQRSRSPDHVSLARAESIFGAELLGCTADLAPIYEHGPPNKALKRTGSLAQDLLTSAPSVRSVRDSICEPMRGRPRTQVQCQPEPPGTLRKRALKWGFRTTRPLSFGVRRPSPFAFGAYRRKGAHLSDLQISIEQGTILEAQRDYSSW